MKITKSYWRDHIHFLKGQCATLHRCEIKADIHLKEKKIELVIKEGTIVGEVVCNVVDRTR